jgi:tetratricopeptide (TPR) repeat protein
MPQWRSRPIFISSTFRDMQAERDHLRNFVLPQLEEDLRRRRHHLEPLDLRQGVETGEAASEDQRELLVLKVCFDEIRRSRPFLIVLLGDRYGWVPPTERAADAVREAGFHTTVAGKSVTALEIEFGTLAEDAESELRCLFYLRRPLPYHAIPDELRATYSEQFALDGQAPARRAALAALKRRLRDDPGLSPRVRAYEAAWDPENGVVTGLEEWGNQVFDDLWRELDDDTRSFAAAPEPRWEEAEEAALAEFIEHRSRTFTGREEIIGQLLAFARSPMGETASWGASVTGPPGSGKSAVFAQLTRELSAEPGLIVLANAAGATQAGSSVDAMLRRWIHQLSGSLGVADPLPAGARAEHVDKAFFSLLHRRSDDTRVVVMLDALDQFESSPRARYLTWIRKEAWPPNARLIATATPGPEARLLAQRIGVVKIALPPLAARAARDTMKGILLRYHVPWSEAVWEAVAAKARPDGNAAVGNPLWLTVACEHLALLDADDFVDAERRYPAEPDPQARLTHLRRDFAKRMPPDVPGLYEWLLARAGKFHGTASTRSFAVAIALSRQGWRETDLRGLMPTLAAALLGQALAGEVGPLKLAELRRAFRAHLTVRGETQLWDFSHAQMRESVRALFLKAPSAVRAAHAVIADHLRLLYPDDPLRRTELMTHLLAADDVKGAAEYYSGQDTTGEPRAAADLALVEHVLSGESVTAAERIVALLEAPGLADDARGRLCARVLGGFLDALQSAAPLTFLAQLTGVVMRHCRLALARQELGLRYYAVLAQGEQRLAHYLYESGDVRGAVEHSETAVAMFRDYARENASSRIAALGLAGALGARAQLHRLLGEPHKSRALLREAESLVLTHREPDIGPFSSPQDRVVDLTQTWRMLAPDRSDADQAAVRGYAERAVLELEAGHIERARELYGDAIALNDRLRAVARDSRDFHQTVWANYQKIRDEGSAGTDDRVEPAESAQILERIGHLLNALDLAELRDGLLGPARRLVLDLDRTHAFLHRQAGYVDVNYGDATAAAGHFEAALDIMTALQAEDPMNLELKTDLVHCYRGMAAAHLVRGSYDAAASFYGQALSLSEELYRRFPDSVTYGRDHAGNLVSLGQVSQHRGALNEAAGYYRQALTLAGRLRRQFPDNPQLEEDYQHAELLYATVREATERQSRPVDLAARLRRALTDRANGAHDGP